MVKSSINLISYCEKKKSATSWRFLPSLQPEIRRALIEPYYLRSLTDPVDEDSFYDELSKAYVVNHLMIYLGEDKFHLRQAGEKGRRGKRGGQKKPTARSTEGEEVASIISEVRNRIGETEYDCLIKYIAPNVCRQAGNLSKVYQAKEVITWINNMTKKGLFGEQQEISSESEEEEEVEISPLDIMAPIAESSAAAAERAKTAKKIVVVKKKKEPKRKELVASKSATISASAEIKQADPQMIEAFYPASFICSNMEFFSLVRDLNQGKPLPPGVFIPSLLHIDIPYLIPKNKKGHWDTLDYAFPQSFRQQGIDDKDLELEYLRAVVNGVVTILGSNNATAVIWCSLKQAGLLLEMCRKNDRIPSAGSNFAARTRVGAQSTQGDRLSRINCMEHFVTLFFGQTPICRYDAADRSNVLIDNWSFKPLKTAGKKQLNDCEKPQNLMRVLVSNYTAPGHWVWDCMSGTMSMAKAALSMGRNVFAFDKDRAQVIPAVQSLIKMFRNNIVSTNVPEGGEVESVIKEVTTITQLDTNSISGKLMLKNLAEAPMEDAFKNRIKNSKQIEKMKSLAKGYGRVGERVWQALGKSEEDFQKIMEEGDDDDDNERAKEVEEESEEEVEEESEEEVEEKSEEEVEEVSEEKVEEVSEEQVKEVSEEEDSEEEQEPNDESEDSEGSEEPHESSSEDGNDNSSVALEQHEGDNPPEDLPEQSEHEQEDPSQEQTEQGDVDVGIQSIENPQKDDLSQFEPGLNVDDDFSQYDPGLVVEETSQDDPPPSQKRSKKVDSSKESSSKKRRTLGLTNQPIFRKIKRS